MNFNRLLPKVAIGLLAVVVPLGTFWAAAGIMSYSPNVNGIDVVEGRNLFRAHCGSCHFATTGFPAHHGPNLHDIGRTGGSRRPGMSAPSYILESILDPAAFVAPSSRPGMPRNVAAQLPPEQVRNIVAFLATRGAYPDYDELAALEIPDRRMSDTAATVVSREGMERAVDVMQAKAGCLKCHSRNHTPESNVFAPIIFNVGLKDKSLVRESIMTPYREVKPNYHSASVILKSGQVLTGKVLARNEDKLSLCVWDNTGSLAIREIPLNEVETEDGRLLVEESSVSIMPTDLDKLLSPVELDDIITLIYQLN